MSETRCSCFLAGGIGRELQGLELVLCVFHDTEFTKDENNGNLYSSCLWQCVMCYSESNNVFYFAGEKIQLICSG